MTATLQPRAMGRDLARRDGAAKVRGTALYADDTPVENPLYCRIVQAPIARGRVRSVDTADASAVTGVVHVLTPNGSEAESAQSTTTTAEELASTDDAELAVLQGTEVSFRGQIVAAVLAETDEIAREAADLVRVEYAVEDADVVLAADRDGLYTPEAVGPGFPADTAQGDMTSAMADAPVTVEQTYTTPMHHNNPMEPHATTALWEPSAQGGRGHLTLWDSTQGVHPVRTAVTEVFGLEPEQVRVICPYVGGGFGSKGPPHAHVAMAAMAARAVPGRPVKFALTRQQMFSLTGYRTPTIQRVQLAADRDGRLRGLALDTVEQTARIKEFAEHTGIASRTMYAAPNRRTTHRLAALDVPVPAWMRAPGECPGMFGPEVAMDELAAELDMDPATVRSTLRNARAALRRLRAAGGDQK
jgi:xanthine dehydrogenase YagR molybdenum-binding subunit